MKKYNSQIYYTFMESPLEPLMLVADKYSLFAVSMTKQDQKHEIGEDWIECDELVPFTIAKKQLTEYFSGNLQSFDIPMKLGGTDFQCLVWNELLKIPFGTTVSYGELAKRIGNPNASRAVGLANGKNPFSIIIPCHRVIGSNGKLTGYNGGMNRKEPDRPKGECDRP